MSDTAVGTVPVNGICDPAFNQVKEEFRTNFTERGETGAALCVVVGGRTVIDLWGGWVGRPEDGRLWEPELLVDIFSASKGLLAICVARLCGAGLLDLEAPVSRYWPEFGAAGKSGITVAQLLSHQAGLPSVHRRLPPDAMFHQEVMSAALAEQEPWWEPGTAHGYHPNTFGFLVGELVRRTTGRSVGTMLRQEVAGPLGADVHIGLPDGLHARVADFLWPGQAPPEVEPHKLTQQELVAAVRLGGGLGEEEGDDPKRKGDTAPVNLDRAQVMEYNVYFNPSRLSGAGGLVNTPQWRRAEIPSANGHATARGLARIYEALARWGELDGSRIAEKEIVKEMIKEQAYGEDVVLHRPSRYGVAFQLTQPERPLGPSPDAFGHFGAGGTLGFCDPDAGVAFGYVIGSMGPRWQNPRYRALIDALYASLG
jgi:CubicO group peptidase (beta-lactamase class C family)